MSNMDFVHALFSESRYPPFGLQLEQHSVLLLMALLMQWMDAEPTVNDQAQDSGELYAASNVLVCVPFEPPSSECKTQFLNFFNCTWN